MCESHLDDPIHEAAKHGDLAKVQAELQAGVNPDGVDRWGVHSYGMGWTALHYAARNGHAAVVGALVGGGATVGAVGNYGQTALHLAARYGHAAVVKHLVGASAGVDAVTKIGDTPLSLAAREGKTEAAAALLGAGADATRPTAARRGPGKTAAEWAREWGHPAVAELIEAHLAQAVQPMKVAEKDLFRAVMQQDIVKIQALLDGGVDIQAQNKAEETPLEMAINRGKQRAADFLTEYIESKPPTRLESAAPESACEDAPAATAATDLVFCAAEWAANQAAGKFDDQGVLFHIGTEGGASAWSNPHEAGRVVVSWSSVRDSDSDIQNFVSFNRMGFKGTESCTSRSAGSGQWMMVDLGAGRTLKVNHYAMRSGHDASQTVRNWELQGAATGAGPWTTLKSHSADSSLEAAPWSVAAWPVAGAGHWRCFRIRATGPAQLAARLDCGGIELYGSLRDGAGAAPAASL
eukprot:COSAG01_NODE_14200_length_1484_cov_1.036101_2_plen_464_part_01